MSSLNKGTSPLEEEEEKIEDGPVSDSLNTINEAVVPSSPPSSPSGKRITWPVKTKKTPSPTMQQRRLSTVSKMYDIDGDGVLDEAELAMRKMDSRGVGHLSNDKVFLIMKEQLEQQNQLFKLKKVLIALSVLVVLLTLSNLGTSFAAAYLAKDSTVNDKEELVNSNTKETLSTQTTSKKYGVEALPQDEDGEQEEGRRLQCLEDNSGDLDCESVAGGDGYVINDDGNRRNGGACNSIRRECEAGKTVDIYRTFSNQEAVTINICGPSTTVFVNARRGLTTFKASGLSKIYMETTKTGCKFNGQALTQQAGETCDTGSDCARGHKCYKMSENSVSSCRTKCARTFDKVRNQNRCAENCFGNTCELINKNLVLAGTTDDPTMFPSFRPTPRPTPSPTRTPRPTKTPKPTRNPTRKPVPAQTPVPTRQPVPTPTPRPTPPMCDRLTDNDGIASTLQDLLWTTKPKEGLLLQTPDYLASDWRAMSHTNMHMMASNPAYPITAWKKQPGESCNQGYDFGANYCQDEGGACPNEGHQCTDGTNGPNNWAPDDCSGYDADPLWDYAPVSLVYGTNYKQNEGRSEYSNNGVVQVKVCYPTDSNGSDKRIFDDGSKVTNGEGGCHADDGINNDQDYVCDQPNNAGTCLTGSTNCKCYYDGVPGSKAGEWISKYSSMYCGYGNKQPQKNFQDFIACWYDANVEKDMNEFVAHARSMWTERTNWNALTVPNTAGGPSEGDKTYLGWTECTGMVEGKQFADAADALVIALPSSPTKPQGQSSLCDLTVQAQERLKETLNGFWEAGAPWYRTNLPVVVMEQTKGGLSQNQCTTYWGGTSCDDGYQKNIFKQEFKFDDGSCLKRGNDGNVYFHGNGGGGNC